MKSRSVWIIVIVVGVILLLVIPGLFMMGGFWGGYGGMMGGYGMMGRGYGFMQPFGWLGMLFAWLIPIAILVLIVLGAIWFFNSLKNPGNPTSSILSNRNCSNCGKPVQADWKTCPYCGNSLS